MSQQKRASFLRRVFFGEVTPNLPAENPFLTKKDNVVSGRRLITREEAAKVSSLEPGDPGLSFGGIKVGSKTNAIICGQTQSGKSTLLKQMMAEALLKIGKGTDERAVIYDATGDFIPFVYGVMGNDAPVVILDPEDQRGYAWNVSADITKPTQAKSLADILIPKDAHEEPFFANGARGLVKAIIECFLLHKEDARKREEAFSWTLLDVFNAIKTKKRACEVLSYWTGRGDKDFEQEVELFLERSNNDILSTILTKVGDSLLVAAMWDKLPGLSIKEFVESEDGKVIVITNSNETSSVVKELNRLFMERLAQILLDVPSRKGRKKRTYLFLDEFAELGKLEATKDLLKLGLKKGVRLCLCYQNYEEVKEVYGDKEASVILSESSTIAFLRQTGDSAKAAAEFIGKQIAIITNQSQSRGGGTQGINYQDGNNNQQAERWTVPPEHFDTEILPANPQNGIGGFFMSPSVRNVWFHQHQWEELKDIATVDSENPDHDPKKPREGIEYQFLRDWAVEEKQKFGVSIVASEKGQESRKAQRPAVEAMAKDKNSSEFTSEYLERLRRLKEPQLEREEIQSLIQGAGREAH
jgi:type IV secretory pathway TraG/TraD family ATPase VirD4